MSFIIRQQEQPEAIMVHMQSQHDWIMSQQALSPLTQVMQTPSLVISHEHMPMVMLQQHTIMPFIMQQQLQRAPPIIEQRFWSIMQAILSSHEQVIFMPPVHFSIFIMHLGIIIPDMAAVGIPMAFMFMPGVMPVIIIPLVIGFMVLVVMAQSFVLVFQLPLPTGEHSLAQLRNVVDFAITLTGDAKVTISTSHVGVYKIMLYVMEVGDESRAIKRLLVR